MGLQYCASSTVAAAEAVDLAGDARLAEAPGAVAGAGVA